jgi:dATP pyrophosphohydrolase
LSDAAHKIPESALVVIYTPALEVLLLERADRPGFWQSVTGSRHAGEDLRDTAIREVAEETGIDARNHLLTPWNLQNVYEIYAVWRHRYAPGVQFNTEHVFGLRVPRPLAVTLSPREHLASAWLPWREAAARAFSWSNRRAILELPRREGVDEQA